MARPRDETGPMAHILTADRANVDEAVSLLTEAMSDFLKRSREERTRQLFALKANIAALLESCAAIDPKGAMTKRIRGLQKMIAMLEEVSSRQPG